MRTPHTSCRKGKRVFVILKNGTSFVDKFMDKKANYVFFEVQGKIKTGDIKVFGIRR